MNENDLSTARELGNMSARMHIMEQSLHMMGQDVKLLVEQSNKQKGAAWATLGIGSMVGSLAGYIASKFPHLFS